MVVYKKKGVFMDVVGCELLSLTPRITFGHKRIE